MVFRRVFSNRQPFPSELPEKYLPILEVFLHTLTQCYEIDLQYLL